MKINSTRRKFSKRTVFELQMLMRFFYFCFFLPPDVSHPPEHVVSDVTYWIQNIRKKINWNPESIIDSNKSRYYINKSISTGHGPRSLQRDDSCVHAMSRVIWQLWPQLIHPTEKKWIWKSEWKIQWWFW